MAQSPREQTRSAASQGWSRSQRSQSASLHFAKPSGGATLRKTDTPIALARLGGGYTLVQGKAAGGGAAVLHAEHAGQARRNHRILARLERRQLALDDALDAAQVHALLGEDLLADLLLHIQHHLRVAHQRRAAGHAGAAAAAQLSHLDHHAEVRRGAGGQAQLAQVGSARLALGIAAGGGGEGGEESEAAEHRSFLITR